MEALSYSVNTDDINNNVNEDDFALEQGEGDDGKPTAMQKSNEIFEKSINQFSNAIQSVAQSMQLMAQAFVQNQVTFAQPRAPPPPPTSQIRSSFYSQNVTSPQVPSNLDLILEESSASFRNYRSFIEF